ncbi:Telomerase reverse transcriptase [Taxawa tesnikishii (nom. ined.)]|nr:Telomerase reverse transcriptase [Dothideales sp. JES 119]
MVNGKLVLGKSINSVLNPAFNALKWEKSAFPEKLGSSLFCADDIFPKLQQFRADLVEHGLAEKPLFFAKVDVRSCFDTIPQDQLVQLMNSLLTASRYNSGMEISQRSSAFCADQTNDWLIGRDVASEKRDVILVDGVIQKHESRSKLIGLLREHVENNMVQIGKRLYRQRIGIPQGSIVSSLLCSFFYADLEREVLGFTWNTGTLLLRLIDDFLLISTRRDVAQRFVEIMHAGVPQYGLAVKNEKTRTNFDSQVDGSSFARLPQVTEFPYCGYAINTVNLNITRDEARRRQNSKFFPARWYEAY